MENTFTPHDLDVFSRTVDRAGIEALPNDVIEQLADSAVGLGASPLAAGIACSDDEPRVVRERALLALVARLIGRKRKPTDAGDDEFCIA